jgi:hypothetical protein
MLTINRGMKRRNRMNVAADDTIVRVDWKRRSAEMNVTMAQQMIPAPRWNVSKYPERMIQNENRIRKVTAARIPLVR